jgi:hypothetical protein
VLAGAKPQAVGDHHAMTDISGNRASDGVATYLGRGDPTGRFAGYHPAWMEKLAGDVTLEGSMLDGALQGADAIRAVIGGVRELVPAPDHRNADGQTQHIAAHYRPLGSLRFFSCLPRERLAGTRYAEHFLGGEV